jgi:hypothetical protein
MKKSKIPVFECVLAVLLLVTATSRAHAYIDPGAGTIILQGAIATVAGGMLAFRTYWRRVRDRLTGSKKKDPEAL